MQVEVARKDSYFSPPQPSKAVDKIVAKYRKLAKTKKSGKLRITDIDPDDVDALLDRYATDLHYDVYELSKVLGFSRTQMYNLLHSDRVLPVYESARNQRASLALKRGVDVLEDNITLAREGESNRDLTNATKNLANYMLTYAQMISKEYNLNARDNQGAVSINITLPEFNSSVLDCGVVKVDTGAGDGTET